MKPTRPKKMPGKGQRNKPAHNKSGRDRGSRQDGAEQRTQKPTSNLRAKNHNRRPATGGLPEGVLHLYGLHTVRAALANPERRKRKLIVTENALGRIEDDFPTDPDFIVDIRSLAELDEIMGPEAVHQGIVLECDVLNSYDSSELFNLVDARIILALDQITDPHNVGAILRSAVAMGVEAVLLTSRNSAAETAVLAKSASGALDMIKTLELRNLSKGLAELNDMGFATIGLDSEGPLVLEDTLEQQKGKPVCLVLGSEGKGLREKTRETCTALARLDMPGAIKSLNVSNAAALSLYLVASGQK